MKVNIELLLLLLLECSWSTTLPWIHWSDDWKKDCRCKWREDVECQWIRNRTILSRWEMEVFTLPARSTVEICWRRDDACMTCIFDWTLGVHRWWTDLSGHSDRCDSLRRSISLLFYSMTPWRRKVKSIDHEQLWCEVVPSTDDPDRQRISTKRSMEIFVRSVEQVKKISMKCRPSSSSDVKRLTRNSPISSAFFDNRWKENGRWTFRCAQHFILSIDLLSLGRVRGGGGVRGEGAKRPFCFARLCASWTTVWAALSGSTCVHLPRSRTDLRLFRMC